MNIYLEAGSGFNGGHDVYGREIVGSAETSPTIRACCEELNRHTEVSDKSIRVIPLTETAPAGISAGDLLISVHFNFYRDSAGVGLRGYYRSTHLSNSERCKALAITVTKALHDHVDMYYHGVFNEKSQQHPELASMSKSKAVSCIVELGFDEAFKEKAGDLQLHQNIGSGIARGILRHLSALH